MVSRGQLVGEHVGFADAEAVAGLQRYAGVFAGQRVMRLAAIGVHIDARERLADELIRRDLTDALDEGVATLWI